MKKIHQVKGKQLFDPDKIATKIHQAVTRDLNSLEFDASTKMYVQRQTSEFLKKYVSLSDSTQHLEALTYKKFLDVNEHMAGYSGSISLDPTKRINSRMSYPEKVLRRARALMYDVVRDLDITTWFHACKHAHGSTVGVPFIDTSLEARWSYPLSVTSDAKPWFDQYMRWDSCLQRSVIEHNRPHHIGEMYEVVQGSRATTVDKTNSIRRMIAIEPTCNMFLQQGLMTILYRRMKRVGLDIERLPDLHKQYARESSITSRKATIDFSSASDCVSIELLRWLLPPFWFRAIMSVRSPFMLINNEWVRLNMVSTMGNAVTFPLETLVFWTLGHAVVLTEDKSTNTLYPEWDNLQCVSVFGDDCILPSEFAESFMDSARSLGFLVNDDKSFWGTEGFRESCGGDYFHGSEVRPHYLRAPSSRNLSALEPWLYIQMNSFKQKYIAYFGELTWLYERDFFSTMLSLFDKYNLELKVVPSNYPEDAGFHISDDLVRFLNCYPFRVSKITRSNNGTYTFQYLKFRYRSKGGPMCDGIRYFTRLKPSSSDTDIIAHNPTGWLFRLSGKTIRGRSLDRKQWSTRTVRRGGSYVVAKGLTSFWTLPRFR